MDDTLERVIQAITKQVQNYYQGIPPNSADTYLGDRINFGYQLIFGVTNSDPMASDTRNYQSQFQGELQNNFLAPIFLAFPYTAKENLLQVLNGLSEEFKANLNIDRLIRDIKFNTGRPVFIVITVIRFPIIVPVK